MSHPGGEATAAGTNGHSPALGAPPAFTPAADGCDTTCDTTSVDVAPVSQPRWYRALVSLDLAAMWPAMVAAFGGLLAIGFAMSFHGLYGFGDLIMHWNAVLCALAPIGIDMFSILALLGTFLVRHSPAKVRAYVWTVFGSSVALSIAGNALHEIAQATRRAGGTGLHFQGTADQVSALIGASVWPAFYAVALHTLIVVRRAIDTRKGQERARYDELVAAAKVEQNLELRAVRLAATGGTVAGIMTELDLDDTQRRNIERWTKPVRDALRAAAQPPDRPTGTTGRKR